MVACSLQKTSGIDIFNHITQKYGNKSEFLSEYVWHPYHVINRLKQHSLTKIAERNVKVQSCQEEYKIKTHQKQCPFGLTLWK